MFFVEKLLGFKPVEFIKSVLLPIIIVTLIVGLVSYGTYNYLNANSILDFLINSAIIASYSLITAITVGLSKSEKKLLSNLIIRKLKWKK